MKLLALAGDIRATIAGIRLVQPLQALAAEAGEHELRLRSLHECTPADLAWADVLILQRPITERAWRLQASMQAQGAPVLVDIDDLLTEPAPTLTHRAALEAGQRWLRAALAAADGVTVSTARLGRALAPFVRAWHEVPNHGVPGPLEAPPPRQGAWPTLLLASSDHAPTAAIAEALRTVQRQAPGPRLVAVGPVAADLSAAGVRVEAQPLRPRAEFLAWVQTLPGAVALVPLGDTAFDACKSAIKYFDFALCGVPVLASARPPYSDVVVDQQTAWLVPETVAGWHAALLRARDDPQALARLAAAARDDVAARFTLAHSVRAWGALLTTLPARRTAVAPPAGFRAWIGQAMVRLRQANRGRLERRNARGRDGSV